VNTAGAADNKLYRSAPHTIGWRGAVGFKGDLFAGDVGPCGPQPRDFLRLRSMRTGEPTFWNLHATGWSAVTALATAGLVLVAVGAAWVAVGQVRAFVRTFHEETRAYVIADFEQNHAVPLFIEFVLRNSGRTSASDVRLTWDKTPERATAHPRPFAGAGITQGIATMAPGREIRILFESLEERHKRNDLPWIYQVTVQYSDIYGTPHTDIFALDLQIFVGADYLVTRSIHDVGEALRSIAEHIKSSGLPRGQLGVVTETREQVQERDRHR
jgi:hypothetical protein